MSTLTRSALVRYVFPFDAQGQLDILMFARNAATYLRHNLYVVGMLILLQWPLTGIPPWSTQMPQTWWQIAYTMLLFPFGTTASIAACILLDTGLFRNLD